MRHPKALPEREYLSPPEAGALVGSRPETVVGWIRSGELRAVNFGRKGGLRPRWRIHREELEAFLRRRSNLPQATPVSRTRRDAAVRQYV